MKRTIIILIVCFVATQAAAQNVLIRGIILNYSNQMQVEDMSEISDLSLPSLERNFILDSLGNFSVSFKLSKANYFRIGRNILYLTPGDSLEVKLDFNKPTNALFKGNNRTSILANEYLRFTPFPKGGSFLDAGKHLKKTIQATIDTIQVIALQRKQQLDQTQLVNTEFYQLESIRIKADIVNSIYHIPVYYAWKYKLKGDSLQQFMDEAKRISKPYYSQYLKDAIDPDYLKIAVYRDVIYTVLDNAPETEKSNKVKEFDRAATIFNKLQGLNNKTEITALLPDIKSVKDPNYQLALSKTYDRKMGLANGDQAPDLKFLDKNHKTVSLKSFKGKIVYIDLWASWCGPCLEEMPHLDSLKKKFSKNQDLVFISLSIEDNFQSWKNYIDKKQFSGVQLYIDRSALKDYSVITIPRIIIIDRDFSIASLSGSLPSSTKTIDFLNKLVAKAGKP